MKLTRNHLSLVLAAAGLATLVACGGGGGGGGTSSSSSSLSGTVAGGAAVIGTVMVKDSLGATKSATIEADGHYTIDVAGMTGPFIVKAVGTVGNTAITYYSAATTADVGGTINVTPFTNLIVSNIAGQLAENYFETNSPSTSMINASNLTTAQSNLQTKLAPVLTALGVSGTIDLLRASFSANHSGLDAVMDMVKVEADPQTNVITLKNAITGNTLGTNNTADSATQTTAVDSNQLTGISTEAVTDTQAIVAKLKAFSDMFASALPGTNSLVNSGIFDSATFMHNGATLAEFETDVTTSSEAVGLKFNNVAVTLDPADANKAKMTAQLSSSTAGFGEKVMFKFIRTDVNSPWKVLGNQRKAGIHARAESMLSYWKSIEVGTGNELASGYTRTNGMTFHIETDTYNANHSGNPIASAIVTGPGLPQAGVTFVPNGSANWLKIQDFADYSTDTIGECGVSASSTTKVYPSTACITLSGTTDNAEYTVVLKNAGGTSLNGTGYTITVPKKPYATTVIAYPSSFPVITSAQINGVDVSPASVVNLSSASNLSLAWTLPTNTSNVGAGTWVNPVSGTGFNIWKTSMTSTAASTLIGLASTPTTLGVSSNGGISVSVKDAYGRRFTTSKSFHIQADTN